MNLVATKDVEYGGWFNFRKQGNLDTVAKMSDIAIFEGDAGSVSVPQGNYCVHWHTHPECLIYDYQSFDRTGETQPPSPQDMSVLSYLYYDSSGKSNKCMRRLVFTTHGIYLTYPIPRVLDRLLPGYKHSARKQNHEKWMDRWFKPFKKDMGRYFNNMKTLAIDLAGVNEDTWEVEFASESDARILNAAILEQEREMFEAARGYGIMVKKLGDVKRCMKYGIEIDIPVL